MEAHLQAGAAIHNAGGYRAAHDAWEEGWLALESGTPDEQLLHGLIQFTVAVFHATTGNRRGASKLADSAHTYLADLPADYRDINVAEVRESLPILGADPAAVTPDDVPSVCHDGQPLGFADLDFEATAVVAAALADARDDDEQLVVRATRYAREDLDANRASSPFVTLLFDYVRNPDDRGIAFQRLSEHASRRQYEEDDVAGLFE